MEMMGGCVARTGGSPPRSILLSQGDSALEEVQHPRSNPPMRQLSGLGPLEAAGGETGRTLLLLLLLLFFHLKKRSQK